MTGGGGEMLCKEAHTVYVAAIQLEGNLSSCLLAGAPQNVPHPYQYRLQRPSSSAECLGFYVLNRFPFKFSLIYLNSGESVEAGHSLGLSLTFLNCGNCETAVISAQPEGMASNGAYPVLGLGITKNPGTSMPVSTALPFATPAPSPAHGPPLVTALVPSGGPPVLSAFPRTPLVAGQDG
ncbi:NUT family member 2E [Plecturocebus cupreus]